MDDDLITIDPILLDARTSSKGSHLSRHTSGSELAHAGHEQSKHYTLGSGLLTEGFNGSGLHALGYSNTLDNGTSYQELKPFAAANNS